MKDMRKLLCRGLILLFIAPSAGCVERRSPSRYLIPTGFVGWIRVEYQVVNRPPLLKEGSFRLLKIPKTGVLKTSTAMESGVGANEFYYVSKDGQRQRISQSDSPNRFIWGGKYSPNGSNERYFVGSKQQYLSFGVKTP